jgi:hypothetical protein
MTGHERLNFARDLAQNGKNEEALKEYEWLWLNLLKQDPAMVGVRGSFMASDMTRLAEEYAPAKARFAELRDELEVKLKGKDKSWDDLGDWIVLNEIIDDQERTLAWIDRIKGDADAAATLNRFGFRLKPLLVEHGRFMDLGLIIRDPVREVSDSARMLKLHMEMQPNLKDIPPEFQKELREMPKKRFRDDVGLVYAAMLVSKREADAARVAAAGVKADDTGMMRSALVEWAIKAKVVGSDQQKLLDEAEEKGEDVKELRRQLNRLSGES